VIKTIVVFYVLSALFSLVGSKISQVTAMTIFVATVFCSLKRAKYLSIPQEKKTKTNNNQQKEQ